PYYHTGLRATYGFTDRIYVTLAGYNGWNSVVDNNEEKSVSAQFTYNIQDRLTYQLLYFGGVERSADAPEGRPWRHLVDTYVAWYPAAWMSWLVHVDAGAESNHFGTSSWVGEAVYLRLRLLPWLFLAGREDYLWENIPKDATGSARPIF